LRSPGKQQYYDPIVEGQDVDAQVQMRAIGVAEPGTYILFEDMLAAIESFALTLDSFAKQRGIHELLDWLEGTGGSFAEETEEPAKPVGRIFRTKDDPAKIELYPDGDRKWHARLVDLEGNDIGEANGGSFDRNWVEEDARQQYPDLEIIQMESEDDDSSWTGKGPSPRLWKKK